MIKRLIAKLLAPQIRDHDPLLQVGRLALDLSVDHAQTRTGLDVLRIVHLAQVIHAGRTGTALFKDGMLASLMGPMNQRLLDHLKMPLLAAKAGRRHVTLWSQPLDTDAEASVREAVRLTRELTQVQLGAIHRKPMSAFSTVWRPDPSSLLPIGDTSRHVLPKRDAYDGDRIRMQDMIREYPTLFEPATLAAA